MIKLYRISANLITVKITKLYVSNWDIGASLSRQFSSYTVFFFYIKPNIEKMLSDVVIIIIVVTKIF